ncbi:MAG: LON peptidase substrate-binding domain-containing protein [Betaproteobacteria bacterium]
MMWRFGTGGGREPYSLPLFPLKTVLFPGGLMPLKVFEQRYIDMTKACLRENRPFGVCLITRGDEVAANRGATPEIAGVGTLARITDWDMPELGILHVTTHGEGRFQIRSHDVQPSGLVVGEVTPIPIEPAKSLAETYAPLASLLELIATRVGPQNFPAARDYGDASWVGYRLAEFLPLPLHIKQSMLEINDADVRLQVLQKFLAQQGVL